MPVESDRTTSVRRITNPDDATEYVDLRIIDGISFIDPDDNYQETQFTYDNSDQSSRQGEVFEVIGQADPTSRVKVERASRVAVLDPNDRYQETQQFWDNAADPPAHLKTHDTKVYARDAAGAIDESTWLGLRRIDQASLTDPSDNYQETIFELKWDDADPLTGSDANLPGPDTSYDGTTINPPWRIDPWQNIIDVNWSPGASEFAGGVNPPPNRLYSPSWPLPNSSKMTFSFWFRLASIVPNTDTAYGIGPFYWWANNLIFTTYGHPSPLFIGVNSNYSGGIPLNNNDLSIYVSGPDPTAGYLFFSTAANQITAGKWYHALLSFDTNGTGDASGTTKKATLFLNGKNMLPGGSVHDYFPIVGGSSGPFQTDIFGREVAIPALDSSPLFVGAGFTSWNSGAATTDFYQFQVWTGLYLDPAANPSILENFITTTMISGSSVINPAGLDSAALAAYVAAGTPQTDWLSRAAAPNNYGKPAIFLNGSPSKFVNNRGSAGAFAKVGSVTSVKSPHDVPA